MASELYEKGMATRRKVMGDAHIKRRAGRGDELTRRHYELVTEIAWGTVWSRPGLPLKIRSLVTIAMLAALNREDELKGHINGALNNGATSEEIYEVGNLRSTPAGCRLLRFPRLEQRCSSRSRGLYGAWAPLRNPWMSDG